MPEGIRPSRQVLREATQLGQTLASIDPSVVPMLDDAHEYSSYIQFIMAHRHRLSQLPFMQPWEERLQELIEIEARHQGLRVENPAQWDQIEKQISLPIHCAFWYGWEQAQNLTSRYERCVAERRRAQGISSTIAVGSDIPASPEPPAAGTLTDPSTVGGQADSSALPHH